MNFAVDFILVQLDHLVHPNVKESCTFGRGILHTCGSDIRTDAWRTDRLLATASERCWAGVLG